MIKGEDKKYNKWKTRIVNGTFKGRCHEVKVLKVKRLTGYLDRPIQVLFLLDLHCSDSKSDFKNEEKKNESRKVSDGQSILFGQIKNCTQS